MKWIKASKRLPEFKKTVFIKDIKDSNCIIMDHGELQKAKDGELYFSGTSRSYPVNHEKYDVCWLDETPTLTERKHKYFPGNYDNQCCLCKKQIHWCDKMCFVCEECYELNGMEGKTKLPPSSIDRSVSQPGKEGGAWSKEQLSNMLEDVVNELDLSDGMIEKHGPLGTAPAELVREVLKQKDLTIRLLKAGFKHIEPQPSQLGESYNVRKEIDWHNANVKMVCELEEELATLRAESQAKDTRIKELEKERDDFALKFAQWFHEQDPEWSHDSDQWMIEYDHYDGDQFVEKRMGFTDAQLITEYKKQLTK